MEKHNKSGNVSFQEAPIRTIKELWDATIKYHSDGIFDTAAMNEVDGRLDPKISYQDLTNVFSAVYANTYWNGLKLDVSILSKSLQSALALNPEQANIYATTALKQWRGMFSRNNMTDTGTIPKLGGITQSPDIVCNNDTEIPLDNLIKNWNSPYWSTPKVGKNYVYVRSQSLSFRGLQQPNVRMFYSTAGFNQPPTSWIQLLTVDGGAKEGRLKPQDGDLGSPFKESTRGCSEAFFFEPKSADHVCIIGVIGAEFFENRLAVDDGNWNSNVWIRNNGAAVWHNVDPQTSSVERLKFYNQDSSEELFSFVLKCRNVPKGYTVELKHEGKDLIFGTRPIQIVDGNEIIGTRVTLPGNYSGDLEILIAGENGELLPENASVTCEMIWKVNDQHKNYLDAVYMHGTIAHLAENRHVSVSLGEFTFHG